MWKLYRWTIMVESEEARDGLERDAKNSLSDLAFHDKLNGHEVYSTDGVYVGVNPAKSWSFGAEGRALQVTLATRNGRRVLRGLNAILGKYSERDKVVDSIPVKNFL